MIVVSDSTTLIILANQQRFDLLNNLFTEVLIPDAVWHEVQAKKSLVLPSFLARKSLTPTDDLATLMHLLDRGESEAILLAKSLHLPLIIDERKGRRVASQMGVPIIGLLGIIAMNVKKGFLTRSDAQAFLETVREAGYRVSQTLIEAMFTHLSTND